MNLYEITKDFEELFNQYEDIASYEFTPDGNGGFLDDDGNPVDPAAVREEMTQAWFDTLDGMEQEVKYKAENVALYIKSLKADADALKAEKNRLEARLKAKEKSIESMTGYLKNCLEAAKLKKIETPRAVIFIKDNAKSLIIGDKAKLIQWAENNGHDDCLKYADPEIRKTPIKQLLNSGEKVPFVSLARTQSVIIK